VPGQRPAVGEMAIPAPDCSPPCLFSDAVLQSTQGAATSPESSVVFYSMLGHVSEMANAAVEGAEEVGGAGVTMWQVAEPVPDEVLYSSGARGARQAFRVCR